MQNLKKVKVPDFDTIDDYNLLGFSEEAMKERFTLKETQDALKKIFDTPRACLGLIAAKARKFLSFNDSTANIAVVAGYDLAGVHGDNEEIWNQFK